MAGTSGLRCWASPWRPKIQPLKANGFSSKSLKIYPFLGVSFAVFFFCSPLPSFAHFWLLFVATATWLILSAIASCILCHHFPLNWFIACFFLVFSGGLREPTFDSGAKTLPKHLQIDIMKQEIFP